MIELTEEKIDHQAALQAVAHPDAGANLLFLGTTRRWTGDVETLQLNYEGYREMAKKEMQQLRCQAMKRWALQEVCVVHRLGTVPVGEASLAVAISSPHRAAAIEAAEWLIDTLKEKVPIWKQEVTSSGERTWIHPDQAEATQ